MYKSVLVATDGSETAGEAVRIAVELAKTFGATLHVVSVYQSGSKAALRITELTGAYPGSVDTLSIARHLARRHRLERPHARRSRRRPTPTSGPSPIASCRSPRTSRWS